jgi:protein TonB
VFENLIESKPKKERTLLQTVTSIVVHTVLILGVVRLTAGVAETAAGLVQQETSFLLPPEPPPPPPPPETPPPDAVVSENPPPQGFQTIMPPKDLPTEIPPVNLNEKFDARDFSGRGVAGGVATGVIGGTGPVITDAVAAGQTYTSDQVDDPVQRTGGPDPVYPSVMKDVGIEGVVRVRFVVGANGRVESGSIQVVSSTNKAFEQPAINAVRRSEFRPARFQGQAVRQLVEQTIRFTLTS